MSKAKTLYFHLIIEEPRKSDFHPADFFPLTGRANISALKKYCSAETCNMLNIIDNIDTRSSISSAIVYSGDKVEHVFNIDCKDKLLATKMAQAIVNVYKDGCLIEDKTKIVFNEYKRISEDVTLNLDF